MGDPQGYEELVPCVDGRICGTSPYCRRPRICIVDPVCAGEVQLHHLKAEVKVLVSNAQVWRQNIQVSERGKGI